MVYTLKVKTIGWYAAAFVAVSAGMYKAFEMIDNLPSVKEHKEERAYAVDCVREAFGKAGLDQTNVKENTMRGDVLETPVIVGAAKMPNGSDFQVITNLSPSHSGRRSISLDFVTDVPGSDETIKVATDVGRNIMKFCKYTSVAAELKQ